MNENFQNLTSRFAENITTLKYEDFPEELKIRARQLFADGIAVAVAGSHQEAPPKILAENAKEMGGAPQASVIGLGFKTSMVQAAMVNGGSMHVLDYEPMWNPPNHQLSTCLPAILALAENRNLDGKAVLTAMVKGIEAMCALRAASNQKNLNDVPFHPPGMVGPIGAVVGAAELLNLSSEQLRNALGIVGSRSGSLMANTGTATKCLHCGQSSSAGLDSALLAEKDFTGNTDILEAPKGYIESFFGFDSFDAETLLGYGTNFRIIKPGYEIKRFPSNFGTHLPIFSALDLRDRISGTEDIAKITIKGPYLPYVNRPAPKTGLDGKFSVQYTAVRALLDGKVTLQSFTDAARFDPRVEKLLAITEFEMDKDMPAEIGKAWFSISITLKDGTIVNSQLNPADFEFGVKPPTNEEHRVKLESCFATRLNQEETTRAISLCTAIDSLSSEELQELMGLIRC